MRLVDLLDRESSSLVERLHGFTPARYRAAAPPFESRAAAAYHLLVELARLSGAPAQPPRLHDLALADQLAVVTHDLVTSNPSDRVVAAALAEIALHRRDLDGSAPIPDVAAEVVPVLDTAADATPAGLLLLATTSCSAYR